MANRKPLFQHINGLWLALLINETEEDCSLQFEVLQFVVKDDVN